MRERQAQRAQLAPQNGVTGVRRGTPARPRLPVSNRARARLLARVPAVKGGVETNVVSPAVRELLERHKFPYAREVKFELLQDGVPVVRGRFDIVFRDPGTGELVFPELKGDNLMALTRNQKIYVPLFKEPGGARVRILGTDATHVAGLVLPTGHEEMVHGDNFTVVGSENLAEFTQTIEARATGKRGTNFLFADGKMRVFHSQEEFDAHIGGMDIAPRTVPPPAKGEKVLKPPEPADAPNPLYDPPGKKPPPGSSADPTAGPPGPFRKGPNFKPTPHDSPPPERTGGGRGGADTQAPAMEFEGSNVKLYRGVGTAEAADLMAHHEWSYAPSGGGKYFAFTKQDAMNAAAKLYPEGATIVEISVPRAIVPTTIDQPLLVHHPHLSSHTGEATMIEGEVNVFYDPRAGGWSLHVDDEALDVVNAEMTAPMIHDSSFPTIGAESAPAAEHPPAPAAKHAPAAPATATEQVRTYGPGEIKEDFVAKMAAEQEAQVLRPGRYVRIGGMVYAMVRVGGALLFLNDVIARGPIEAGKTWGIMGILTERIAMTAGGAVAGVVGLVLFMPSDQAGGAEQLEAIEKADVLDGMIHDAFPDIVGPRRPLCIGDCTAGNRHIFEPELFRKIRAQMEVAVAHAWTIEDDEAIWRRKRREAVAAEHRHELVKDRAREAEVDEMMNAWRTRPTGFYVSASVGDEAINKPDDVQRTTKRLHELGFLDKPTTDLDELGSAIYQYQYSILHQDKPDSRVDPRGRTEAALRAGKRVSMAL